MKLTWKKVPPAVVEFAPSDERFTGFMLHLSSDRRGVNEKAWGAAKDPKGKKVGANELAYVNARDEATIVGWSGFRLDMLPDLEVSTAAFDVPDDAGEDAEIEFDRHTRSGLFANSTLFEKLAGKAVQLHHGNEDEDDEDESEEEDRKND